MYNINDEVFVYKDKKIIKYKIYSIHIQLDCDIEYRLQLIDRDIHFNSEQLLEYNEITVSELSVAKTKKELKEKLIKKKTELFNKEIERIKEL